MPARAAEAIGAYDAGISSAQAVSGDTALNRISRGVYVGVSGNITVQFAGDAAQVTLPGLAAGVWHPMQVQAFFASGTTATGIFAGF